MFFLHSKLGSEQMVNAQFKAICPLKSPVLLVLSATITLSALSRARLQCTGVVEGWALAQSCLLGYPLPPWPLPLASRLELLLSGWGFCLQVGKSTNS